MSNTITIDLDSLSPERAEKMAGFILTYAGVEGDEDNIVGPMVKVSDHVKIYVDPQSVAEDFGPNEPSAAEVFSSVTNVPNLPSLISAVGPQLVIPNPPPTAVAPVSVISSQTAVTVTAVSPTGVIVDKEGLPWDARIHSSAKTFNADGTWRARRGLPDGYVPQIEAELKKLMAIPSPQSADGALASTPSAAPVQSAAVQSSAANIPPPPLPPATASPAIQPYLNLMNKVSSALAGGRISQPQLQKVCDAVGLPNFVSLGTRLDLVPVVAPMIDGILAGGNV